MDCKSKHSLEKLRFVRWNTLEFRGTQMPEHLQRLITFNQMFLNSRRLLWKDCMFVQVYNEDY